METFQPRRCLVFADKKSSTRRVAESLRARGLRRVRTLPLEDAPDGAPEDGGAAEAAGEGWEGTVVYVGSERWGRGLDLRLRYVFLLSPPANSASYMHMAGRTGRQGAEGTCVTLLEHRQAPRLVAFAQALGVPFQPLA